MVRRRAAHAGPAIAADHQMDPLLVERQLRPDHDRLPECPRPGVTYHTSSAPLRFGVVTTRARSGVADPAARPRLPGGRGRGRPRDPRGRSVRTARGTPVPAPPARAAGGSRPPRRPARGTPRGTRGGVAPQHKPAPGGRRIARAQDLRGYPAQRRVGDEADAAGARLPGAQPPQHGSRDVPAVEGGAVGGVDRVHEVADREDPGARRARARCRPRARGWRGRGRAHRARTSSWSGTQSPVVTTVSHAIVRRRPVSRCSTSTDSTRSRPEIRTTRVRGEHAGSAARAGRRARKAR